MLNKSRKPFSFFLRKKLFSYIYKKNKLKSSKNFTNLNYEFIIKDFLLVNIFDDFLDSRLFISFFESKIVNFYNFTFYGFSNDNFTPSMNFNLIVKFCFIKRRIRHRNLSWAKFIHYIDCFRFNISIYTNFFFTWTDPKLFINHFILQIYKYPSYYSQKIWFKSSNLIIKYLTLLGYTERIDRLKFINIRTINYTIRGRVLRNKLAKKAKFSRIGLLSLRRNNTNFINFTVSSCFDFYVTR